MELTQHRRPRPRRGPVQPNGSLTVPQRSNQVWTVDFKGSFRTGDGTRVHPLTVRDLFSRYILCVRVWRYERHDPVRCVFARLFRRYGRPKVIRCDHGVPWASTGPLNLSRLSVWWWTLGIRVDFTDRGCPGQNGAHEQHHRELKAETAQPPARTLPAQQKRLDRWRRDYNQRRPHETLGQKMPVAHYHFKPAPRKLIPIPPRYTKAVAQRRVHPNGEIAWEGNRRFVGDAFAGHHVGLYLLEEGVWSVRFLHMEIGHLHRTDPGGMRPASVSRTAT
jgi:transposase InsO family protein